MVCPGKSSADSSGKSGSPTSAGGSGPDWLALLLLALLLLALLLLALLLLALLLLARGSALAAKAGASSAAASGLCEARGAVGTAALARAQSHTPPPPNASPSRTPVHA
jgi:hypothetical protein